MCTVTLIPKGKNDFILTSNRDEAPNRISLPPSFYNIENTNLLYPKDEQSGGTWIGVSANNRLVCVLNGGFEIHERKASYRKSRGIVAHDFMVADYLVSFVETYNFDNIEPFTLVIADWNTILIFYELVWDGTQTHFKELPLESRIWSSSTLYSKKMRIERSQWFENFKSENELSPESLLKFHKTAGKGNEDYGVIMNRGFVRTTSITQVEKINNIVGMRYENLRNKLVSNETFNLSQLINE
ncbi:NRDE family protein [Litoribaculum gwangyangense]|uniref:NRDE family protein n=1 Tax=Litoribaculum gwangyangense TaxID=1130722 RepID=A0ABP9CL67_9FLAO